MKKTAIIPFLMAAACAQEPFDLNEIPQDQATHEAETSSSIFFTEMEKQLANSRKRLLANFANTAKTGQRANYGEAGYVLCNDSDVFGTNKVTHQVANLPNSEDVFCAITNADGGEQRSASRRTLDELSLAMDNRDKNSGLIEGSIGMYIEVGEDGEYTGCTGFQGRGGDGVALPLAQCTKVWNDETAQIKDLVVEQKKLLK